MCIIAIYSKGQTPSRDILQRMIDNNGDGIGVAYNNGKTVKFVKGLTTADEVYEVLERAKQDKYKQFVFHARIATSGGISASKCHPFIMSDKNAKLDKTKGDAEAVCFHNGIFSINVEQGLNDTQTFIKKCLFPLWATNKKALLRGNYDRLIGQAVTGSRFVLMTPKGLRLFGSGWEKDGGVWYSNSGYKPAPKYERWERWQNARWEQGRWSEASYMPAKYRVQSLIGEGELEW